MYKLTARQLDHISEIQRDQSVIKDVLDQAMSYYSNRANELRKAEQDWWLEMKLIYNLDLKKVYVTKHIDGATHIVLKEEGNDHDE